MLRLILTLGAVVAVVLADEEEKVPYCEELKGMPNLDLTRLKGTWWEWASSGTISFLMPHSCHVSNFYPSTDGKSVNAFNDYVTIKKEKKEYKQEHVKYSWKITDETPAGNGPREYVVQIENFMGDVKVIPMTVIYTDYNRYLIISLCKDAAHFLKKFKSALLLTRNKSWSEDDLSDINSKVDAALAGVGKTREDLGLVHSPFLVKNCEMPKFPDTPPPFPDTNTSPPTQNGYGAQQLSNTAQQPFAAQRLGTQNGYGAQQLSNTAQQPGLAAQRLGTATNGYGAQQPSNNAQRPGPAIGYAAQQSGNMAQKPNYAPQQLSYAARPATPSFAAPPSGYPAKPAASAAAASDDYDYESEDEDDTDTSVPINNNYGTQNAARPYSGAYSAYGNRKNY